MIQIYNLTEEQRKQKLEVIINKLMYSDSDNIKRNTKWKNREFVFQTIQEYLHYLLIERNKKVSERNARGIITEEEALSHLEKTYNYRSKPNVDKLKRTMETLDTCFDPGDSNYILKKHGKICNDSLDNLKEKLTIIKKHGYEEAIVSSPQKLRGSSEWIESRLCYYEEMIARGLETRNLASIPATELLSDKDRFSTGNGKKISEKRKNEIRERYGEGR